MGESRITIIWKRLLSARTRAEPLSAEGSEPATDEIL
jgi:hypothetical protein